MSASRTQVWLEGLGEWSWPGQGGAAAEVSAAAMGARVPAAPRSRGRWPRAAGAARLPGRARARRLLTGVLLSALAVVLVALAQGGS